MNRGERGRNVFTVQDEGEMRNALGKIFDKSSRDYDYIALVQEYIEPVLEYRVAVAAGKPVFAYARNVFEPMTGGRLSRFQDACGILVKKLGISWGALDFIESKDGRLFFLEANTKPMYEGFIAKNGEALIKELYKTALSSMLGGKHFTKVS
jgi:glutathione synthase/RimK-type ligase-like ATP-grasp enzyme